MKKENNSVDQLFDKLRQSPTELSLEKMELIISSLPNNSTKPTRKDDWTDFFNFKNIMMIAIPIISITIVLLSYTGKEEVLNKITQADNVKIENTINEVEPTKDVTTIEIKENQTSTTLKDSQQSDQLIQPTVNSVVPPTKNDLVSSVDTGLTKKDTPKNKDKEKTTDKKYRQGMSTTKPIIDNDLSIDPVPKMTGMGLRNLKRVLYKNLKADGIIASKSTAVKIELSGNQIVINDQILDGNLFLKYSQLTRKAGTGADRKIEMSDKHIMVGDFTEAGFKGSGVGTFVTKFADTDDVGRLFGPPKLPNQEFDLEREELNIFAQEILDKSPARKGNRKLFSVNLDEDESRELFVELYKNLVSDQLIFSDKDYVLIELPKKEIRINGKKLSTAHDTKYAKIFSDYKIGRGAIRQLRLSEHILSLGDFKNGNFSGSTLTFPEN